MAHCLGSTPVCGVLLIVSSPLLSVLACFLCHCILCLVWTTHAQFIVGFMSWLLDVTFWQRRWDCQLYIHTKEGWLQLDSWMSFSPTARGCWHTWSRYRFLCGKRHQEEASFCVAVCGRWKEFSPSSQTSCLLRSQQTSLSVCCKRCFWCTSNRNSGARREYHQLRSGAPSSRHSMQIWSSPGWSPTWKVSVWHSERKHSEPLLEANLWLTEAIEFVISSEAADRNAQELKEVAHASVSPWNGQDRYCCSNNHKECDCHNKNQSAIHVVKGALGQGLPFWTADVDPTNV